MGISQGHDAAAPYEPRADHLAKVRQAALAAGLPASAQAALDREIARLEQTDPGAPGYAGGLDYLDCLLTVPWNVSTPDNLDLNHARMILGEEHYGLERVKERVLEYQASRIMIGRRPSKVLIVDDEEVARTNLTRVFAKEGYMADGAANGQDALKMAETGHYDLIVTDLKMDKMDGLTLLEKVKAVSPATEVVLVTGYATVDTAVSAFKKGAVHYFTKPVNLAELRAGVAAILDAKRRLSLSRGSILCFAGPPGTGKTSIGRSIARSLGRAFVRVCLAGLQGEAELRGLHRSNVGAGPGRIIAELRRLGYNNPVFMLDDADKAGRDFHGDLSSVLLDILDPEHNGEFLDQYLDVPFDLSRTMFIATASIAESLPRPLLDRLEIIDFASYTPAEKRSIARRHILPRQLEANGLPHDHVLFKDSALDAIIAGYTREAGLLSLERELASICRGLDRIILSGTACLPLTVDEEFARTMLGPRKFTREAAGEQDKIGVATGLVRTEYGGQAVFVTSVCMKGKGELTLTGQS
ncbi:MAG: response regulator, partial [Desulfovibrionaceae bacterium]|nr:response regulator [Desulfovibrionaceae bacterium]